MAKVTSTDEWATAVRKHIEKLKDTEERYNFAHTVIFDTALWAGYNSYETLGILRAVEHDLIEAMRDIACDGDCDHCDGKEDDE